MTPAGSERRYRSIHKHLALLAFGLTFCVGTLPLAARQHAPDQDRNEAPPAAAPQDSQGQGQPEVPPPDSPQQPQPQDQPQDQQPPYPQAPQDQPAPQAQGQPQLNQRVPPQTITIPAGTVIRVRVDEWISS